MKKKWLVSVLVVLVLAFAFGFAQPTQAAEFDEDGSVAKGEVIADDLLMTGDQVSMNGTVEGTLLVGGNIVTIGGVVEGDLLVGASRVELVPGSIVKGNIFAGAASIVINGTVEGSVFAGGRYITAGPNAMIDGNIYTGSYALEIVKGSVIGKDVFAGSAQAHLAGEVGRDVNLGSAAVLVDGTIGRNLKVDLGNAGESGVGADPNLYMHDVPRQDIPDKVEFGLNVAETAVIGGALEYTSTVDLSDGIHSQPAAGIVFSTPVPGENDQNWMERTGNTGFAAKTVTDWIWHNTQLFLVTIIGGSVAVAFWLDCLKDTAKVAKEKIWANLGIGALAIPGIYIASVLAFGLVITVSLLLWVITLGGLGWNIFSMLSLALALFMSVFGLYIKFGTAILAAWVIGEFLREKLFPNQGKFVAILLGAFGFAILAGIPVLGWLFKAFVALVGVGALWTGLFGKKAGSSGVTDGFVTVSA